MAVWPLPAAPVTTLKPIDHPMRVQYEDLSPQQFEALVVAICQFILGAGVQGFATGRDGGRDAKFVGTADLLPSKAAPWQGTIIIQAKHTNGYNQTFSDTDFYSPDNNNSVLAKELSRIKALRVTQGLDHYLLFSNRRLTGNGESRLRALIGQECGLPEISVMLNGVEQIDLWLRRFPDAVRIANIDPVDSPLLVRPDDLAEVVEHLAEHLGHDAPSSEIPPTARTSYERKNALNNMSPEYARQIQRNYLKDTPQIEKFLAAPENSHIQARYSAAVEDFQLHVIAKRRDYQSFDEVLNYLNDLVLARDPLLRAHRRLTRLMLFYMYWHCDLGVSDDA